jgi:hypothetical protein
MSRRLAFTLLLVVLPTLSGVAGGLAQERSLVVAGTMQFSAATYSVDENAGTATVRVTHTGALASNVTVEFTTTNGTATAPADYLDATQVLTFAAGEAFKDVPVTIVDDDVAEGNRTVVLTLSNPSPGAALGTIKTAVLTIRDDEQGLQFSAPVYVANEAMPTVTITVVRTGPTVGTVTVDYASADASATPGADYTSVGAPSSRRSSSDNRGKSSRSTAAAANTSTYLPSPRPFSHSARLFMGGYRSMPSAPMPASKQAEPCQCHEGARLGLGISFA